GGALERSLDLAAALEVRGYAGARRPARVPRRWSRHDVRVAATALALAGAAIAARLAGAGSFDPYPTTHVALSGGALVLTAALPLIAVLPFATPRARMGVARA
ncbi:MAG: hypothetical protein ACJ76V_00340, partial [Thermoleophilaceae bacterium]